MADYKIVFTDYYYPNNSKELEILNQLGDVDIVDCTKLVNGGAKDEDQVIQYAKDADAIIVQFARISRKVIEHLEKCKIISRYAIGLDNIDIEAAKEKGMVVSNVPDYCIEEVSDTTIAHMFNCVRKVTVAHNLLQAGEFAYARIKPIHRFGSLTVGLIAFGHIARRVAEKIRPFGNPILAFDPYFKDTATYPWVKFVSLEELLNQADILSIHAPLTKESHHLINKDSFALMKDGVVIVNTSRGGLMDESALAEALKSGKVASAGLDVLEYADEDYGKSVLVRFADRVFITPHMGWYSEDSVVDLQRKAAMNVYEMLKNGKPLYQV